MEKTKTSYLTIPTELILNDNISPKAKYLYIMLKKHSFDDSFNMVYDKFMSSIKWKDKRTIKKYLVQLKDNNYISYSFTELIHDKPIVLDIIFSKPFIQIDRNLIEKIISINNHDHEKGLLYIYYLEHMHNTSWGYSCPSVMEIQKITKMQNKQLITLIRLYHKLYICEYVQGNIIDIGESKRTRNRYIVNNIEYNNNMHGIEIGCKRYTRHKKREFFFSDAEL